jgi:hypothetical protein
MCGPSHEEELLSGQAGSLSSELSANYAKNFAAQSEILQNLTNVLSPIAEAGPDQQGFGANELAALSTTVGEGVGQNYAKASQALNTTLGARGGGNEFLPTGAAAALKGNLAASAANELSGEQLGITKANYDTGRSNWQSATAGLNALASEYNPNATAGAATGANQTAFGEAKQVNQEQNQWQADIAGGITALAGGVGGALTGGLGNLDTTGGSSPLEQVGNFFTGMRG